MKVIISPMLSDSRKFSTSRKKAIDSASCGTDHTTWPRRWILVWVVANGLSRRGPSAAKKSRADREAGRRPRRIPGRHGNAAPWYASPASPGADRTARGRVLHRAHWPREAGDE